MSNLKEKKVVIRRTDRVEGELTVPASKSTSIRAVLGASISGGKSTVHNVADNFNTNAMKKACLQLGADIRPSGRAGYTIYGVDKKQMKENVCLNPQNSGIVLRLLLGVTACMENVSFVTEYEKSLAVRSNRDMVEALRTLGVEVSAADSEGRLPISMCGNGLRGGRIQISGRRSSQFLSGLLFLGALMEEDLHIQVTEELKSKPMVETTLSILKQGHVNVSASEDLMDYFIPADQVIRPSEFFVGSDPASACALIAVSSMVQSEVRLNDYREEEMGNGLVLDHIRNIGVQIQREGDSILVKSDGIFKARDFDGSQAPDAVLPLAALSCFAEGTSRFYNIEHIRYKESDRISDFRQELLKAGARVDETQTELIVHGCPDGLKGGAVIDSHFDHAIVMALTAIGLKSDNPIEILGAQYVGQTYPKFFDDIIGFGCRVETIEQKEQERKNVYA